jgi:hypothetical protein
MLSQSVALKRITHEKKVYFSSKTKIFYDRELETDIKERNPFKSTFPDPNLRANPNLAKVLREKSVFRNPENDEVSHPVYPEEPNPKTEDTNEEYRYQVKLNDRHKRIKRYYFYDHAKNGDDDEGNQSNEGNDFETKPISPLFTTYARKSNNNDLNTQDKEIKNKHSIAQEEKKKIFTKEEKEEFREKTRIFQSNLSTEFKELIANKEYQKLLKIWKIQVTKYQSI